MRELYPKGFLQEFSRRILLSKKNFFSPPNSSRNKPIAKELLQPFPSILCGEFFMRSDFYREIERNINFLRSGGNFVLFPPTCAVDQHSRKTLKNGSRMFS